jgi:hypothetical protein
MELFELLSFNDYFRNSGQLFEASTLSQIEGLPKKMIGAIHQKEEHRSEKYKNLGYVHQGGMPVTLQYTYDRPSHDIEIPAPVSFRGRRVPPPDGVERTAWYTDFAQYLQDLPNGPIAVLLAVPEDEVYLYLYYKQKWGGGPNAGGQQYAILVWDRDAKEAVDFGFVGLTTEGVEKTLVRQVHRTKGGNTNGKVQEYISSLTGGAPSLKKKVLAYELEVTPETREKTKERGEAKTSMSLDLIRVFADRYAKLMGDAKTQVKSKIMAEINSISNPYSGGELAIPAEITKFATAIGADPGATFSYLFTKMKEFRENLYKEGGGSYQKTIGYELADEKTIGSKLGLWRGNYDVAFIEDPKDTRVSSYDRRARRLDNEKVKRQIPASGEYAEVASMIKTHTLDNVLHKFAFFIMTGRIDAPAVNVLALLGIDPNSPDLEGLPDFEEWTL